MPYSELVERYLENRKVTRSRNTYKSAYSVSRALRPLPYRAALPIVVAWVRKRAATGSKTRQSGNNFCC